MDLNHRGTIISCESLPLDESSIWCSYLDSNQGPTGYEPVALPLSYKSMVPDERFELSHLSVLDPKSSVSAIPPIRHLRSSY